MSKNERHGGKSGHDDHDGHDSGHHQKVHVLIGTRDDDPLTGTDGKDIIRGRKGDDHIDGGAGNDLLFGDQGDDFVFGGLGNDVLFGGKGNDFLDGGAGNDIVMAGKGNDVANYTLAANQGAHDVYDGGKGLDTLQLTLTSAERARVDVQADIAAFEAFLAREANSHCDDDRTFQFQSIDLDVRNFEALKIVEIGGNTAPDAIDDDLIAQIRVAVVGGSGDSSYKSAANQLIESSEFAFDVTAILDNPNIVWETELANYDVVVLGASGTGFDYVNTSLFSALERFVNDGGGVITTGGFAELLTQLPEAVGTAADIITPITANGFDVAGGGSMITIDGVHEITAGVGGSYDVVLDAPNHELATAGILGPVIEPAIDSGATVLAYHENVNRAAIVVDEVGDGRTAYLGSRHMADPGFGDMQSLRTNGGDADKIFEQAVAWAAGDRGVTIDRVGKVTIDPARLLANDSDVDTGDALAIDMDSFPTTSTNGAAISFDANGDIVYKLAVQDLPDFMAGQVVNDSFIYTVSDGNGGTDIATVNLAIAGLNDILI